MGNSSLLFTLHPGAQRPLSFLHCLHPRTGSSRWARGLGPRSQLLLPESILRRKSCKGCLRTSKCPQHPHFTDGHTEAQRRTEPGPKSLRSCKICPCWVWENMYV